MALVGSLLRNKPFTVTPNRVDVTDPDGKPRIGIEFEIERNVQPTDRYNNENIEFITEQEYNQLTDSAKNDLKNLTKFKEVIDLDFEIKDENGNTLEHDDQTGGPDLIDQNSKSYAGNKRYEFIYYSYLNE